MPHRQASTRKLLLMEYFNILEFNKEPFSNSPEPEFLFASPGHSTCLQRIELAVRLKRGLNIVIGEVGTGKTTLCRKLIQQLSAPAAKDTEEMETFLLLDPAVDGRHAFVRMVASVLGVAGLSADDSEWQVKEKIKSFLFEKGVQEQKNIVLVIDEGQKIPDECLEVLREFLNYETNSFKLLQLVIFAQPEFRKSLKARPNLLDRVNYLYHLRPLSFRQTSDMIRHRIAVASPNPERRPLFTPAGLWAVYLETGGYPRKIVSVCHQVLLMMIIRGRRRAGWHLVRSSITEGSGPGLKRIAWTSLGILLLAAGLSFAFFFMNKTDHAAATSKPERLVSGINLKADLSAGPALSAKSASIPREASEDLGAITIRKKMTLWRVMDNIYGDTGMDISRRLIAANPAIKNIHNTSVGDVVRVPWIEEKACPLDEATRIIFLESGQTLEPIYYSFIEKRSLPDMPAIRFLSFRSKKEGRRFAIALDRRFDGLEEATRAVGALPAGLASSARVVSQWEADTMVLNGGSLAR